MIEIVAGIVGVAFGATLQSWSAANDRYRSGRDAVVKLTTAVEHLAEKFDDMHEDFKADRAEYFKRLNEIEQRVAKLEARSVGWN